jgi:hypothetical protein
VAPARFRKQGGLAETASEKPAAERISELITERKTDMPLIKKAPAMVTLEVKIEEPVKQLLDDYARFIESTADHVVNTVIKKNLWHDQDYRKWREQHRAAQHQEAAKGPVLQKG